MKTYAILSFVFVLLLSGCSLLKGDSDLVLGNEIQIPDATAGTITCSERCELKSQCGTTDGNKVIMGSVNTPAVSGWDMMLADETAVTINTSESRTVQKFTGDQSQENLFFYNVTANDGSGKSGWIAGWCVAAAPQPETQTE